MADIMFRVLGPVEIIHDGRVMAPTTAQQRYVLSMLLLNVGRVVTVDRLASALWPSEPPASTLNTVRVYVSKLRKLIADDPTVTLATVGHGWRLECERERLDLYRFRDLVAGARKLPATRSGEVLREALSLWRGPALADVAGMEQRAFLGAGLDEERLSAVEMRIAADLDTGGASHVIPELAGLLNEHPLRERFAQLQMLALYRSGRQAEALESYRRLHRLLDDELGVSPSDPVEQLHRKILAGDRELLNSVDRVSASAAPPKQDLTIPRQLPASVVHFTGREPQLSELNNLLPDQAGQFGAVQVAVITGIAGVGKTSLAVHWAHRVAHRFPDGQLYVNLRGFDPLKQPMSADEAVSGFLEALGAPMSSPSTDLEGQSGRFRSLLADKRMLILLDNAREVDQVRPLLPGSPGNLVLITGRNRLSGLAAQGAHPISLVGLDTAEASQFLTRRLRERRTSAEPQATKRIIDACAGLPLALAIVAARAASNPEFPLATLAAELHDANALDALADPDPAVDLRAVFSASYQALTDDGARLFRLLSLHPGPDFSLLAAASAAGAAPERVQHLVNEITRANLLIEQTPGRFAYHDLLRTYAAELARAKEARSELDATVRRLLDFYLHTAFESNRLIDPHRDPISISPASPGVTPAGAADGEAAMAWFAAEGTVLLSAVQFAAEKGFDTHCWQVAWTLRDYLERGGWHGQAAAWRTAREAAQRLGDMSAQACLNRHLAEAYSHLGRAEDARSLLDEALHLCKRQNDRVGAAHTHFTHARVWMREGRLAEAIECDQHALDLYRAAGHLSGQANALNSIGWHYSLAGNHRKALLYCERAMSLMRILNDRHGQAATLDSLGLARYHLGQHAEAISNFQDALDLYRDLGNRYDEGETFINLGNTRFATGDVESARFAWRQALDILTEIEHPRAGHVRTKLQDTH